MASTSRFSFFVKYHRSLSYVLQVDTFKNPLNQRNPLYFKSICKENTVNLPPESIDLAYICDTYHHFEYPFYMLESIHKALRPEGRLVIVDFERIKGISQTWILGHVRGGKGTVTDEVKDSGFDLVKEDPFMEEQYFLVFRKR